MSMYDYTWVMFDSKPLWHAKMLVMAYRSPLEYLLNHLPRYHRGKSNYLKVSFWKSNPDIDPKIGNVLEIVEDTFCVYIYRYTYVYIYIYICI